MRHQAEHAQVGAVDAGYVACAAVQAGFRRDLARWCCVAERHQPLAVKPVQRRVIGEVVALTVRQHRAGYLAPLVVVGEGGVGALDPQTAVHRQEAQRRVSQQRAGQQAGLDDDLEPVAGAQQVTPTSHVPADRAHHRRLGCHRPAAQVVAIREPARDHHQIQPVEVGLGVPNHAWRAAGRAFQCYRHVALTVDAGEDDDAGLHGFFEAPGPQGKKRTTLWPIASAAGPSSCVSR